MDHGSYLGDTLEEVAKEKAGIIKDQVPLICGERKPELRKLFADTANNSEQYFIDSDFSSAQGRDDIIYKGKQEINYKLRLIGEHQVSNSSLAIKALEVLEDKGLLESAQIAARGLQYAHWPGRIQKLPNDIYVDGAHNPAAMEKLSSCFPNKKFTVICGMMEDKEIEPTLEKLAPICTKFIAVPIKIPRAIKAPDLAASANKILSCPCESSASWEETLKQVSGPVLITGSLYLSGEVLSKLAPDSALKCDILE